MKKNKNISSQRSFPGNRGGVLIYSLWVLCFMAIFAAAVGNAVNQYVRVGAYFQNSPRARYAAEAALRAAVDVLAADRNEYDALTEAWGPYQDADKKTPAKFKNVPIGQGTFSFEIIDEAQKINLRTASAGTLERFLSEVGHADAQTAHTLANSILDWQDVDDGTREGGAENFYYRALKDSYNTPNRKLEIIEELLWVKGMTPDLFRKIKDLATIWGDGKININTASREVLLSVGCTASLAEKIVSYRLGQDGIAGTKDDKVFDRIELIPEALMSGAFLGMEDEASLLRVYSTSAFAVSSVYFTVKAQGTVGGRTARIDCILDRSGKISSWRE